MSYYHCNPDLHNIENNPKRIIFGLVKKVRLDAEKRFMKKNIGVTRLQYIILHILQTTPMTLKALADRMEMKPPSLVPAMNALVKAKLIHKRQDTGDKRKSILSLSDLGLKKIKSSVFDDNNDLLTQAFNKMSITKRRQLVGLLQELNEKV